MEVDWRSTICGIRLIKIRDLLRRALDEEFDACWVAQSTAASEADANALIKELTNRKLIEVVLNSPASSPRFKLARDGHSLAAAKAIPRISRARAEQILNGFMKRVHEVNDDDDFGVFVGKVYVFGSFLDKSKERLGDLDLIVTLPFRRIVGRPSYTMYADKRQRAVGAEGWFNDFLDHEVRTHLKARDPHISLGSTFLIDAPVPKSLIYTAPDEVSIEHEHRGAKGASSESS